MESSTPHSSSPPFLMIHRVSGLILAVAALCITGLTLLLRYPLVPNFTTHVLGGTEGDPGLYLWLLKSNLNNLLSLPWFNTEIFYPYSKSLAFSDNFLIPSLFIWAALKIGSNFISAFNLLLLASQILTGILTFRLVFKLSGDFFSSLFAAASIVSLCYFTAHLGHTQLQMLWLLPLGIDALISGIYSRTILGGAWIGGVITIAFLTTVYYALFLVVAYLGFALALFSLRPHEFTAREAAHLIIGACGGFLPLLPFLLPYLAVKETFGERQIYEAYYFAAQPLSYLSSSSINLLYGDSLSGSDEERNLFPGLVILLLGIVSLRRITNSKKLTPSFLVLSLFFIFSLCTLSRLFPLAASFQLPLSALFLWGLLLSFFYHLWKMGSLERTLNFNLLTHRALYGIFIALALIFFVLSFGPLGNPEKGILALSPYRFLYAILPGFDSLRAIGRAGIGALFFLIVGVALALPHLLPKRWRAYSIMFLLSLVIAENLPRHLPQQPPRPVPLPYMLLKDQTAPGVALALPLTSELNELKEVRSWSDYAMHATNAMNWNIGSGHPLVNGYSGIKTKFMREAPRELLNFPDKRSLDYLRSLSGLRYVILVPALPAPLVLPPDKELLTLGVKTIGGDPHSGYLLELFSPSPLNSKQELLVPSYPQGVVRLALLGGKKDCEISVSLPLHVPGAPLATVKVVSSKDPFITEVKIPKTSDSVRPLRLEIVSSAPDCATLVDSLFVPKASDG